VKIGFFIAVLVVAWRGSAMSETFPIIDAREGYLIGAVASGKWLESAAAIKSVKATTLPVYGVSGEVGKIQVLKVDTEAEACPDTPIVKLEPERMERGAIAFSGNWNPLPRKPKSLDVTQKVYVDLVREFLLEHKLRDPVVHIAQIVKVDLDGDGEDEVLISATHYQGGDNEPPLASAANTYSFVMLRRVVNGKVKTELVGGECYPKATSDNAPNKYELGALLDLNGDGKIDIVVRSAYYEGDEVTIYECGKSGRKKVLSIGCGA
jgi:hypothetical protein